MKIPASETFISTMVDRIVARFTPLPRDTVRLAGSGEDPKVERR